MEEKLSAVSMLMLAQLSNEDGDGEYEGYESKMNLYSLLSRSEYANTGRTQIVSVYLCEGHQERKVAYIMGHFKLGIIFSLQLKTRTQFRISRMQ